jgi:hypothetical protein
MSNDGEQRQVKQVSLRAYSRGGAVLPATRAAAICGGRGMACAALAQGRA